MTTGVRLIHDICSGTLDLIYPPHCIICKQSNQEYLCAKCVEKIDVIVPPYCQRCGIPCEKYHCPVCDVRDFGFESACSAGIFDGVLRESIHELKYRGRVVLAQPLAELMARWFRESSLAGKIDLVVPIPVHRSRYLERGFNQSAELAQVLCGRLSLPLDTRLLVKTKRTPDQVGLSYDQRAMNLRGAFGVANGSALAGKHILLVDDVFTTGSTLSEAARTLRGAGATRVDAFTLARSV